MCLDKYEHKKLPVWVKLLKILMEAWSVSGISALASSISKPIIMDEVTTKMCLTGVGTIGFARALVEIDAEKELKDKIDIVYKGKNYAEGIRKVGEVEYAWKADVCTHCKVFGHSFLRCKVRLGSEMGIMKEKLNENEFNVVQKK